MIAITGKAPLTEEPPGSCSPPRCIDGLNTVPRPRGLLLGHLCHGVPLGRAGAPKTGIGSTDTELIPAGPACVRQHPRLHHVGFGGAANGCPPGSSD